MTKPFSSEQSFVVNEWLCAACHSPFLPTQIYCTRCGSILPHVTAAQYSPSANTAPTNEIKTAVNDARQPERAASGTTYFHERARLYLTLNDDDVMLPVDLSQPVLLGRTPVQDGENVIDLTTFKAAELGVSRRHALLEVDQNIVYITDLGSANGTQVNARTIPPHTRCALANRLTIHLGNLVLRIRYA